MTKVYQIDCGEFEADIRGTYSTRELAEDANRFYCGQIEEIELDPPVEFRDVPPGSLYFLIAMERDGSYVWEGLDIWRARWPTGFIADGDSARFFQVAPDLETAVRLVNEKRERLIARGIWGSNCKEWTGVDPEIPPISGITVTITREDIIHDGFAALVAGSQVKP